MNVCVMSHRALPGCIAACAVKAAQTINRMRALVAEGIMEHDLTEAIIKKGGYDLPTTTTVGVHRPIIDIFL